MSKTRKRPAPRESKPAARPGHAWRVFALAVLVVAAYSNSFQSGLIFDSAVVIGQDPRIRAATWENLGLILTKDYWYTNATSGLYRPVTTLSYLANYTLLGDEQRPTGYHAINLVLHVVNVALVYALGVAIFAQPGTAMALAGIWGLHPLLSESVTNVVGRADLLAALGVLAGLLCGIRSAQATGFGKLQWLIGLALAQTVGLFSKESAVVLPGLMLLYDLTWTDRVKWRERWPPYAALAIPFAAFFLLRAVSHAHMQIVWSENPLAGAGFVAARLTAVKAIGKLLWLFLWPARLSADYSYNAIPIFGSTASAWENIKAVIALAVFLAAVAFGVRWWRTQKALFFFAGFFFVALAPTSNLIVLIGSILGERFAYLAAVGLAGFLVVAARSAIGRLSSEYPMVRNGAPVLAGVLCLALATRTYSRNFDWHDDLSLWTSTVAVYPESARARNNLGNTLSQIPGKVFDATTEFQAALRIRPDYAEAHYNLANAFAHTGRLPEAIAEYRAALRFPADHSQTQHRVNVHVNLGNALAQTPGELPEAIAEFRAAIQDQPDLAAAHYNLGNALARTPSRMEDAIAEFRTALRIQPDLAEAHYSLGSVLLRMPGRAGEAIAEFEASLRTRPDPELEKLVDQLRAAGPPH